MGSPEDSPLHSAWLTQPVLLPTKASSWLCQEPRKPLPHCCQTPATCELIYSPCCSPHPRAPGSNRSPKVGKDRSMGNQSVPLMWDKVLQERYQAPPGKTQVSRNHSESGICLSLQSPCSTRLQTPASAAPAYTLAARLLGRPPGVVSRPSAASLLPSIFCTQMGSGVGHSRS